MGVFGGRAEALSLEDLVHCRPSAISCSLTEGSVLCLLATVSGVEGFVRGGRGGAVGAGGSCEEEVGSQ